ncbi:hypothetical protein TNCV_4581901 [Trichonephila clavipes]|nr:hypothetical protein TNCV_4581901 [Trichonephila clavipes]
MKLSLLTSHASVSATPRWLGSSLETPWREDAEQMRYAPPLWSCTRYYDCIASLAGLISGSLADRKHVVHGCSTIDSDYTPAATPDQLWQRVEAAWSAVPQEHIQSLFESMPRDLSAGWCGWFFAGFLHPRLRVRLRPESVDFHNAENREWPCCVIIRPFKDLLECLFGLDALGEIKS